jgi:hypothetical protein
MYCTYSTGSDNTTPIKHSTFYTGKKNLEHMIPVEPTPFSYKYFKIVQKYSKCFLVMVLVATSISAFCSSGLMKKYLDCCCETTLNLPDGETNPL